MSSGPSGVVGAVVPAAGRGERLGPGEPKALRLLGGEPLLVHAVRTLTAARLVGPVVVAAPPGDAAEVLALLHAALPGADLTVVDGGASRQHSVALALAALPAAVDVVLVHDAARPLTPPALVDSVAAAVLGGDDAVVPGLPLADTVKRVDRDGLVVDTPERASLRAVQTPQGFRRTVLVAAHAAAGGWEATDCAGLVERSGVRVRVVAGSEEAFKVTRPADLLLAEALLASRRAR